LAKRHIAATTKQPCFGQPKALFEVIGEFGKAKEVIPLPRSQSGMQFALFAPTKVAGRWGQGFAIIGIIAIVGVGLCVIHQVGQWVGKAFVVNGVIGSPKGFGQISGEHPRQPEGCFWLLTLLSFRQFAKLSSSNHKLLRR
jgi:hypothetical protein